MEEVPKQQRMIGGCRLPRDHDIYTVLILLRGMRDQLSSVQLPISVLDLLPGVRLAITLRLGRRRVIALLTTGGVAAVGAVVAINLHHMMAGNALNHQIPQRATSAAPTTGGQQNIPPGHMGTAVGATNMANNTAMNFVNPANHRASLLIHLPNGNFVAYERACTHVGVYVNYDPATHLLVCPAHGAIFDPANGGAVLQGPATRPLPKVTIHVNGDGTITQG
jgi:Rieske Fe-S protein